MPFVYVTGSAGSGKSAVAIELRRLGVDAHDEDDPQIGAAHNLLTGEAVTIPPADERSPKWFSEHEWRLRDGVLQQLRERATDAVVVLCGNVYAPATATALFDRVLHLDIDEDTLRTRVHGRSDNDYGKTPDEMARILERHRALVATVVTADIEKIDATRPVTEVAAAVVDALSRRLPSARA